MSQATEESRPLRVGVVGAGQLARMMAEAASAIGVDVIVLAEHDDDSATALAHEVVRGSAQAYDDLAALAAVCDVITLDHELVNREALARLEAEGVTVHPSSDALAYAADKAVQREAFDLAGLPVPRFRTVTTLDEAVAFAGLLGHVPVVKAPTGGYDGRGVLLTDNDVDFRDAVTTLLAHGPVLLEERVELLGEAAGLIVTSATGERVTYPLVDTVQRDGMCVETRFPTSLRERDRREAEDLLHRVADLVEPVGVMAVEFFVTSAGVLINEIALRPHNSGHWTIEGCHTSQFENHLRAVAGFPLGDSDPVGPCVMVNVVGGDAPLATGTTLDATYHDYGKAWRPGRKLGHVTALADTVEAAAVQAWGAAQALGTAARKE